MDEKFQQHGAFSWGELMTSDQNSAKAFYTSLFGWETEEMAMEGMDYTVVKVGEEPIGGIMLKSPDCKEMPPAWGLYVTVDDIDATAAKVEDLGGRIIRPPTDIPKVGRFCVLQDPQGAIISAITYAEM